MLLLYQAVDYPKTGVPVVLPANLRPDVWPDFFDKKLTASKTYISEKVSSSFPPPHSNLDLT
jgi:hypothetical protein